VARTPLVVDVFELARQRGTVQGALPLAELPRLAASLVRSDGAIRFKVDGLVDDRGQPGAQMWLESDLVLECQRCGGETVFQLRREVRFRFVADEEQLNQLPIDDDDVEEIVGSHHMNVAAWVEDEAILSLPLVARHEHCRPLGEAVPSAAPAREARPNPFAVLARLKRDGTPD
jgi:uncharacterized protein